MWSLYTTTKEGTTFLAPLTFSNGKTQEDIVDEVFQAIKKGYRTIFIKGMCGTGKSAIALNIARQVGKTSIVVPIKTLQEQYTRDYTNYMHVMDKTNGRKLKIASIVGRQNFSCKFMEESIVPLSVLQRETNARLTDIFFGGREKQRESEKNESCDNAQLPCKIEIKEKNLSTIKYYIKQNPALKLSDFSSITDVKRMSVAPICPYWSPILPNEYDVTFKESQKISYRGLEETDFVIHTRKPGCAYYEQYKSYADADVIIFNSLKYKIESVMNRKPLTDIEIIDECDEFLDSFAQQEYIDVQRLLTSLHLLFPKEKTVLDAVQELIRIAESIKKTYPESEEIYPLKNSVLEQLLCFLIDNKSILEEILLDEHNYVHHLLTVALAFADFIDETFFSVEKKDEGIVITLVTTNLKKRYEELVAKNKVLIFMSGTIHSDEVLRYIFGLENFIVIEAETEMPGRMIPCKNGYEIDCKYQNFQSQKITREQYLRTFSKAVSSAKNPTLVHLTSFSDLPTSFEKERYNLDNLPTQQEVKNEQQSDPFGQRIKDFKSKKIPILFTTRCSRGVDFPGDSCNSIVISRFPYPNISGLFWKVLKKTHPDHFMDFYIDKAQRELLQKIYRGLRSRDDRVYLLSPDSRVVEFEV